jgi:YesN/AraC family two-component response regulator
MHGEIKVKSMPGKGSEFIVTLPLGKDHLTVDEYVIVLSEHEKNSGQGIISYPPGAASDKKIRSSEGTVKVLIIEDNEDLRNFIRKSLADQYQVLGAENGRTGINIAYTMMPDIIVTDIMMPDIDGIKLCSQLKNDDRTSHIPIIMLTAKATTDDKLEGLRSGADDYIVKPFIMDELKTRIANLLAIREKLKLKYLNVRISETGMEKPESVDDRFMGKVIRVINDNITNFEFDVGILHELLGMSRMHLSRKLKVLTGLSPHVLIRNIRIEKAAELLILNTGNITEIAYSVGISNASGFTKAFREYFGVSPRKYSKQ